MNINDQFINIPKEYPVSRCPYSTELVKGSLSINVDHKFMQHVLKDDLGSRYFQEMNKLIQITIQQLVNDGPVMFDQEMQQVINDKINQIYINTCNKYAYIGVW